MSTEPTGQWVDPMIRAGATNPRNGQPSWNRLAELAGLSTSTVTAMIAGSRNTSPSVVQKVADVLRVDPSDVSAWTRRSRAVHAAYSPPPEADLLTDRQRKALTALIRSIVADEQDAPAVDEEHIVELRPARLYLTDVEDEAARVDED